MLIAPLYATDDARKWMSTDRGSASPTPTGRARATRSPRRSRRTPGDPEALDGLGQSLWWLGERDAGIERRREAYAALPAAAATRAAPGNVAVYLAGEHRIDGRDAAAAGLAGARRGGCSTGSTTGPEHGWLAIEEAKRAADPAEAERHARAALDIAHALRDPDIECMALAQLGPRGGAPGARRRGRRRCSTRR